MSLRERKLHEWEKHKTPAEVASFMLHSGVGRKYETNGTVWDAPLDIRQTGLLELILLELRLQTRRDKLSLFSEWFVRYHKELTTKTRCLENHRQRIHRKTNISLNALPGTIELDFFSSLYVDGNGWTQRFGREVDRLNKNIKILELVRSIDDLIKVPGIGKKTIAKIRERLPPSGKSA